ncbi:hypothetical protein [Curtobacterium sp. MCBD17_040]|uniref:hypothetical protein n=1 Tax=Curtobacterium sp. MCBD17_040 TaxID=2175674 RepID=UPI000DAA562D|nr:hypothetical protein [Curtobacterium sp. MCBD17_040]WIB65892.1 hypothetical protein DEI94_17405 [Curtobacterium sp. MCBD17_040]
MDITQRTPVDIDTALAAMYKEAFGLSRKQEAQRKELTYFTERVRKGDSYYQRTVASLQETIEQGEARLEELRAEAKPLDDEYQRRPWTRAFLAVTSSDGHVHKTMSCSTCFPTTQFEWLPQYSGHDEAEVVDDAGVRACTVCFPSAPTETLTRETRILSEDERQKQERRLERERAAADRAAKKAAKTVIHPDGKPVYDQYNAEATNITTVTSGAVALTIDVLRSELEDRDAERAKNAYPWGAQFDTDTRAVRRRMDIDSYAPHLQQNLEALAAYHGVTIEEQTAVIREKALTKYLKEYSVAYEPRHEALSAELKALKSAARARKNASDGK